MAGIAERKMTNNNYDGTRCYNYFTRIQSNTNDIHSMNAKEQFKRPLYHLGKEKKNEVKNDI